MDSPTHILHLLPLFWRLISRVEYIFEGTYTARVLASVGELLSQLWYFALAAVIVAAVFSIFLSGERMLEFLGSRGRSAVAVACLLGVISPLPTFAAIPLVAALFQKGISLPPLMAFLVASPLMNPALFVLTAGAMGVKMALARTISALLLGGSAGALTSYLLKGNKLNFAVNNPGSQQQNCRLHYGGRPKNSTEKSRQQPWINLFLKEFWSLLTFIGKYFLLGVFIAAIVQVLIPLEWIVCLLGRQGRFAVLIAVAVGVPLYACGGGSIPIIEVLTRMGMSQGAALAFFISGPATKFSTLITLYATFKERTVIFYLLITLVGATILGYTYSLFS